jgi:hypothetical protein
VTWAAIMATASSGASSAIFPWIGGRPIANVTAPELLAVVRRIGQGALTAHRALGGWAGVPLPWRTGVHCSIHSATYAARCPR